jgi:fibronectin-binding autotransporter adhesin
MKSNPYCNKFIKARMSSLGRAGFAMSILATAALISFPCAHAETYTYSVGGTSTWSTTTNWTPTAPTGGPSGMGVVVERTAATNATVTQDVVGGGTVGTIRNSGDASFAITPTNSITLNQDGAGSGAALITLTGTNAASRLVINSGTGGLVLADDLAVTQSNPNSTLTTGAILLNAITGTGNIAFNNVMNDLSRGLIIFNTNLASTGTLTIASGAVRGQGGAPFNPANAINLGVTDGTSASLLGHRSGSQTIANGITVAAVASGNRTVLGSTFVQSTGTTTFSGNMTLNGDLTVTSQMVQTDGNATGVVLSGILSGTGGLFINGSFTNAGASLTTTGAVKMSNANNTFSGTTRIAAGTLFVTNATALQNSTVDLNASDAGTLAFGSTTTIGLESATLGGLSGSRNLVLEAHKLPLEPLR